ncbi:hypothetical protein [Vineibacter terrae]|nr:hypothetical protein [Vineibacter terrae]HEX2891635.1 hypothetical protein [Vineibacter terrae]
MNNAPVSAGVIGRGCRTSSANFAASESACVTGVADVSAANLVMRGTQGA